MLDKSLLRQAVMANGKQNRQTENNDKSILRRSLEKQAGVAPGSFAPTNTVVPTTPQRIYKPGAKAYAPINLRSLAESTIVPASSQEQTVPKYVSPFAKNEDYGKLSRYKSTKNSEEIDNRNFIDKAIDWIIGAKDNEESKKYNSVTGYTTKDYDDELYEYINKNPDVVSRVNTNEATSGQYFSGVDQSFLQEMEDAEVADYNYLYATQGKDKANEFLQNLKKDLTKRQMDKYVAENQQYARENPVAASAWSVLAKPLEGVSLAGQLMDYKLDRDIDPNAGYNRFVKQNQTILSTVPENWSKVGQFLYGTGMSVADNLFNMALTGAFGNVGGLGEGAQSLILGIMGSSAAAESTLNALEEGYSADRAMIQGALAGGIEALTEKISLETLLSPNAFKDGTIKYLLKNMAAEGSEEGASTISNWVVDWIGDLITDENRSDFRQVFTAFDRGDTKEGWRKIGEMGLDLVQDVAGGMLSGGILAGGGSLTNLAANTITGRNANVDYSQSQIGKYVQESFNDTVGNKDASDYQQSLAKKAMNQFDQNGKVSNRTLGELMQSNAYEESEQNASNELLAKAMEQIDSGKTVTDSTVKQILDNKKTVDYLTKNSGLRLQNGMTRAERFQAVRNSLNQTIQQVDDVLAPARREVSQKYELYKRKTDMISEFAKTLGKEGGRTLSRMAANEDLPNITSLAGAYTKVYNEVKANPEVNLNEVSDEIDNRFTPSQLYSVYQAAVADRETDFKENGVPYEGEVTNGRSEDNGGNRVGQTDVDSGVGVESISRWTAETEKGNQTSERARIIAKNQAAVSGQPKVTAKEAGFANGSNRDEHRTTQVVPEENWASLDEDTYSFFKELKSQGYNVIGYVGDTFFEDPLSTNDRGEHPVVTMRGFQQGKTIGVRVDAELSARQIIMHELFHDMVAFDSALQGRMLDKLNDKYKGRMDRVFEDYVRHYEWMLPEDATPEQIEEWTNRVYNEILADAYAGIEPLRYTMNYRTASQFTSDVREMVAGNGLESDANSTRAEPAFSRDKWQIDGQMSLSDLEGYYQEKYDNVSEENIKTAAKETKGIIERIQNFQDKEVRNKSEKRVLGNIRTIALGITSEFVKTGYIDFGGLKLSKNPSKAAAQIASYAMILRNPNFETFRILYTKGNQIVGNSAVTSYNVDTSYAALDKDMETSNGMIRDQMKRLGADGYYLMHNHPSGSVNYSNADKQMTDYYRKTIAGFKGHIIIDHNQYGFFDASPDMKYSVNDIENGNAKDIHSRRIDSPLLYNVINGPESLADIARYVVHNNDVSTLIYAHKDGIRAIQEVSNKFLLSKDFKNYVNNRKLDFGSVQTFLVTNMKTFNKVDDSNLFGTGIFTDVVGDGETDELFGKSFYSLHELGRGQFGTVKEAGLYRVYEKDNGAPIQYSRDTAPEFYSKLEREIEGYKGEKLGAASVTSYLKGKGVKDEEIKWTGIATFLEGKKSVSKADLLQYVRDNQVQIEEDSDSADEQLPYVDDDLNEYHSVSELESMAKQIAWERGLDPNLVEVGIDDKYDFIYAEVNGERIIEAHHPDEYDLNDSFNRWSSYKVPGGSNYREILYKIPGSAYSNPAMKQHWDKTGVLAHARIQDFETDDGKILFVDEIQSDWHNAGEKSGYSNGEDTKDKSYYAKAIQDNEEAFVLDNRYLDFEDRLKDAGYKGAGIDMMVSFLFTQENRGAVLKALGKLPQDVSDYLDEYTKKNDDLQKEWEKAPAYKLAVPDAPFRNGTYIQYVLKDLLRKAAEGGYDYLAWTTGKMQEDRWSSEYAEGYRIEYDQDIPKFLSKYGKQWGAKLTEIPLSPFGNTANEEDSAVITEYAQDVDALYQFWHDFAPADFERSMLFDRLGYLTGNIDYAADKLLDSGFTQEEIDRAREISETLDNAYDEGIITGEMFAERDEDSDEFYTGAVPAIPITEAMKESVLYEGQPRFSRDTTGMESELQKQNRELNRELKEVTERYHYFKDQLVLTKVRQATEQSANRVAKQLVKDYSSNVSADEIAKALREASKLVLNVKDDTDIDELQTQLKDALRPYAMQMVTNASELMNAEDVETQKSIRNGLRNGTGIIVTDQMKKDVPDWASFRKAQFGNMKLVSGPKTNIHDVYLELSQKYGEGYFPADVANESDMLQVIADVMADLSAIYDNPYTYGGADIAEAIESCTNDMMMSVVGSLEAESPTFADKEKAKRDKLRKEAIEAKNAALQRVREQRDDAIAKQSARYKDRIKSIYDKRQQYELRTRIRKKVKDLADKLTKPTDDKHIPYALQGAVIDVLNQINTGSKFDLTPEGSRVERGEGIATRKTNAFLKLKEQLTELRGQLVLDDDLFDSEDSTGILSDLALFPDTSIDALNSEDLQKVLTVIQSCENAVRTWNRMFNEAKWAEISEAGEAIYSENADKVGRPEYQPAVERTIDLLTVDMATPEAYFGRMGASGKTLFKMLRAAQDENIRMMSEAQKFSQDRGLYDLKLKNYERKMVTVRFGNRDVEMSKAQLMELYILNKREASRAHIEVGGILPEPVQKKWSLKKVTYSEPIRNVTQEDIAKAMSQLSPEDIKIAEAMQEFVSTVMTKHGNDAAMRVYGYKKFGEENYWPIRVNDQDLRTELGAVRTRARSVSKKGFTNAIKPNAKQSVVIGSIFDTFNEHVAEMANYASHLAVMEDMKRIYNFTEKNEDGAIEVSTKYTLRNVFGPQGTKYFEKLMQDLSNGTVSEQAYFGGLIGRFKAAAVGSNLRVILQQPTAIFRAMDMISPKYLAQGFLHVKSGREKALKNAPIAQWKDWGYFDINTGRSTKNILFENSSTLDRVQNVLMSGAGLADSISWGALYSAVEAEIKDTRPDLDARSNAFNEVVAERFADIIDHSQVVDGVLQRSGIMRSENAIDKMATSFMAEPTKQFNMLASAIYNFRHSTKENKAQAGKVLARTTAAMVFAGVLNAAVQSIVDALRNDDPEKDYWEKFLEKFTGEEDTLISFMSSNVGDFLNPAQYVPYAKDIVSIIQGYDVERMDVSLINDLYTDAKSMVISFSGKGKYSTTNNIINFMNTASKFLGLSIGNVKRDVAGIANTIAQGTGSYVFEYRMAKFTYNLNQATNKGRFVEVLAKAYEAGDQEAFDIIMNDLIKEDKFATTTMTTEEWIKKRLKDKHQIILK